MDGDYRSALRRKKQKAACPRENTDRPSSESFREYAHVPFFFFHAALQPFSRDITVESAPAAAAIRPEKFIFDRAGDAPILHSIKGTLFLI
ncbi:hypothetical protein [Burkholderia dolosa]|uniref:hypothetical protein n=1 Tax=Burkholderia dolosa TaxID=152500 RepID=UPI001B8F2207|nr:hypothetical protein [Burkholderia dolosa]MBR8058231.1 hypothetical protein [Burkholderia dolosa]MBR8299366.1 hypothetical protein [Burkholderia dolosa]